MKTPKILLITLLTIIASAFAARAQNTTISPYSRFGYGMLKDHVSSAQAAMGGVGYAMNNGRQINVMNPASYAAIDTLTFLFDIGVDFRYLKSSQANGDDIARGHNTSGGLNYVTMQFPVTKYMGMSVGLLPYSQTGYAFGDEVVNGESSFFGSGTVNELYAGISGRPFKGFTIGANFSYLFGTLTNGEYVYTDNGSTTLFERAIDIRDFDLRIGAQYSFNIGRKNRFTLGVVYSPQMNFHGHAEGIKYDTSLDTTPDTIGYCNLRENARRAATYGAGLNYTWNERLMVELDYTYQPWKKCSVPHFDEHPDYPVLGISKFNDRWKTAFGVQYQPDPRGNYFKRIRFRLGTYLAQDYLNIEGNKVKDIGITCGFGLPAPINRFTKTVVNLGFEYRRRTSSPASLVKENYFQVTLGINFNELWFWQNKIQ